MLIAFINLLLKRYIILEQALSYIMHLFNNKLMHYKKEILLTKAFCFMKINIVDKLKFS